MLAILYSYVDYGRELEQRAYSTQTHDEMKMQTANHNSSFSRSTHSTKCHHIKMCARKIKANELLVVHRHSVSVVAGLYKCTCYPHTRPPACLPFLYVRTYSQDVWPLIVLVGSVFRYHRLPPELLSTSLSLLQNNNFFIFIWLQKRAFGSCFHSISLHYITLHYISSYILPQSCVTFVHI